MRSADTTLRPDRHRLRAPRPFTPELSRPHLEDLVERATAHSIVLVQADAGYGKTAFARRCAQGRPAAWYCLDASDNDPQRFTGHLTASLKGVVRVGMASAVQSADSGWLDAVDELIEHLEVGLPELALLVIDDLHVIDDEQTLSALAYFLERLPAPLTAVVTTQNRPSLPGLHRWQADGRLMTVGRDDLRFREDEVVPFFAARFGQELTDEESRTVHDRCEGWPIAMNLLGTALAASTRPQSGADPVGRLAELPRERLAEYLRAHVLAGHDQSTREFLLKTAVVDDFDRGLADAIVTESTAAVLDRVERSGLYLTSDGQGTYSYQGWFRDFLRAEIDEESRVLSQERAALHFEGRGRLEDAVVQYTAAGRLQNAAQLLDLLAPELVSVGQHARLLTLSAPLPRDLLSQHPPLALARADALRFGCRFDESEHEANAALQQAIDHPNPATAFAALERLVQVHLDTVRPVKAEEALAEMEAQLGELGDPQRHRWGRLRAENDLNAGRLARAAVRLTERPPEPLLAARIDARLGNLQAAMGHLGSAPGDSARRAPRSHRERSALAAWLLGLQGDGDGAYREALTGIETGRVLGSPIIECVCTGRAGLARLCSDFAGELPSAVQLLQDSLRLADSIRLPRFRVEGLIGLTVAHGRRDDWLRARQSGIEALEILSDAGDDYLAGMAQLSLGIAAVLCSHPEADQWLEAARDTSTATGEHFIGTAAALWQAQLQLIAGDSRSATDSAATSLRAIRDHALDCLLTAPSWLGMQNPAQRRQLAELGLGDPEVAPYARYLADHNESRTKAAGHRAEPWGLHVRVLGDFTAHVDGVAVPDNAWRRRKARELFWLLCAHPRHSITRAEAADALWPEGDVDPSSVRFRVALHALREALEPSRSAGSTRFVHSNDERIWLDPLVTVDVDAYREGASVASRVGAPTDAARRAVDLYAGQLLPAAAGPEWIEPWRAELAESWRGFALQTAANDLEEGTAAPVLPMLREVIRDAPYEERAYRLLARALVRTGQPAAARALYAECEQRLVADLGVRPSWGLDDVGL